MKKFFSIFFNSFKDDWKVLISIVRGEAKPRITFDDVKKNFKSSVREYWMFFLIIFLAFVLGMFLSANYYAHKCNEFIVEEFEPIISKCLGYSKEFESLDLNFSVYLNSSSSGPS